MTGTPNQQRTDGELLAEFVQTGSEAAMTALVQRHGAMVHGVCHQVLDDHYEAEDVAQTVFLALTRKAAGFRKDPSVAIWLHQAVRVTSSLFTLSGRQGLGDRTGPVDLQRDAPE
jgi:hypothetical protein